MKKRIQENEKTTGNISGKVRKRRVIKKGKKKVRKRQEDKRRRKTDEIINYKKKELRTAVARIRKE